ncbi:hypothetical protein EK21DRAFT_109672 [Setomelanomma holmii]|uniref:Xylanolytic transcriptional activator regulatory domain-containing protein n=1 Tax=Setomelanomma holmii TaxID=210430 RepID=A0A9P4HFF8_9PLEO|nr:hypothetical protein EK21DRAFT_109672 [Setomelanomma holmii]
MAADIIVLEQYLMSRSAGTQQTSKPYNTISTNSTNPIVYLTVPRRRKGVMPSIDPGGPPKEIIEQVLRPYATEVRQLYFDCLHPCFPILDEYGFGELWTKDRSSISSTLLCDMYASALIYWDRCDTLRAHPKPDTNFVWNQAAISLQDDFMGPTISTVHAALLDMIGRPVLLDGAITGNIVNAGRVAALAQSLGLHRNPTSWKITPHEKNVRIRLWWGVLVHDYWSSLCHGIPPTTNLKHYDTPLVTMKAFATSSISQEHSHTVSTFVLLCRLTRILGETLPDVYTIFVELEEVYRSFRKIECDLDEWLADLPSHLKPDISSMGESVNGTSNLWLAYLSIKILVCRVVFKATRKDTQISNEARQFRLAILREAPLEVVDFVASLRDDKLQEFWLPYTSYLLVTAATVLLRSAIECGDLATKRSCVEKLLVFRARLQRASDDCGWNLADFCLERCHEPIQRLADAMGVLPQSPRTEVMNANPEEMRSAHDRVETEADAAASDVLLPEDLLECPLEIMWDTFDGSWPLQQL